MVMKTKGGLLSLQMTVETIAMFVGNVGAESRDNIRRKEVDL